MSEDKKKRPDSFYIEIDLRGRFLTMSCDIEWTLLHIMIHSTPDPQNQKRDFAGMMMSDKIQNTIADLKKYKKAYFKQYKKELEKLTEFRNIRNDMAHNKIDFYDKSDLAKFRAYWIDKDNGQERVFQREYTREYLLDAISRFEKLNLVLAELVQKLRDDYNSINPLQSR